MTTQYEEARERLLNATNYQVAGKDCEIATLPEGQAFITWSHQIMKVQGQSLFDDRVTAKIVKNNTTIPFKRDAIVTPVKEIL